MTDSTETHSKAKPGQARDPGIDQPALGHGTKMAALLGTELPGEVEKEGGRKEGKDRQTGRPVLTQRPRTSYCPVLLGTYVVTCSPSHPPQRLLSGSM